MFRLAHLSDLHLGPLPDVSYRELASKRMTGYVNWTRNRRRTMHDGITDRILADMHAADPDHVAITGDLVNLALDAEIEAARLWLEELGDPHGVSLVPGNHDAYVPGALDRACHFWREWMSGDGKNGPVDRHSFPYLRVRDQVAIIGVSSARASAPFVARGYFREDQAERLGKLLEVTGKKKLFRVVLIHHPPVRGAVPSLGRLFGIRLFGQVLEQHGAELVLHGHTHLSTLHHLPGRDGRVPVVGVASGGQGPGTRKPAAQYNLFEIGGEPGKWQVHLTRRGISGPSLGLADCECLDLYTADARENA